MRLHGHAPRRGPLPDRDRDGVRKPRRRMDPAPPPRGRERAGRGRHIPLRLPRPLGPGRAGDPAAAHRCRPLERRVPLHALAGGRGRAGSLPRPPGHVRRRARLGALLPDGVRPTSLRRGLGGGQGARPRRGRLQGDRLAPAREGLPRLGCRHHSGRESVRGRPRFRRQARQGRLHRPRGDRGRIEVRAGAPAGLPRPLRSTVGRARLRAGARRGGDGRPRDERRLRLLRRALDRVCVSAERGRAARPSGRGRDLRRLGRGRGRRRAALGSEGERIRS